MSKFKFSDITVFEYPPKQTVATVNSLLINSV